MQTTALIFSGISMIASVGTFLIVAKVAREMQITKTQVETDVANFKSKTNRNMRRLREVISQMEF